MLKVSLTLALLLMLATSAVADLPRDPAPTPNLSPDEAVKKFRVPEGFEVRLFAAEPDVVNPVSMTWDDRGRLWVVELIDYPYTTKEGAKNRDRVKVLEDTDGDGRADKVTVFADGLNLATAIQIDGGGVYVGAAPNLWYMQDTNGDDVADTKKILLTGFGLEDRHELLNSFSWGPDGQMYFTHGVFTQSKVTDPERPERAPVKFNAGVMRYHPGDNTVDLWADGISNQWGVDWDGRGNAFVSACVVEHLWHVVPGGVYVRQGGIPGWPHAYDLLKHINDHKHFRAAYAGIQIYQGGAYPAEYNGTAFIGNIHGNCINQDKLVANGSSFIGQDLHKGKDHVDDAFLNTTDGWFRPVSTQIGPDGNLWIMDWYDKYPCYQNSRAPDLDRSLGRIWRVVYTGKEKGKAVASRPAGLNLLKLSNEQLVETLKDKNVWMRRHAQRILNERYPDRAEAAVSEPLRKALAELFNDKTQPVETRLAAYWTQQAGNNRVRADRDPAFTDSDESVRAWAARFAGECGEAGGPELVALRRLASDPSLAVRAAVAESARRLSRLDTLGILLALLDQSGGGDDPMLPQLTWYAVEPKLLATPEPFLEFYAHNSVAASGALIPRSIARRLYTSGDAKMVDLLFTFLRTNKNEPVTAVMLDGILAGHKNFMTAPADGEALAAELAKSANKNVVENAKQLATVWGAKASVASALKMLADTKAPEMDRAASVKLLRGNKSPEVHAALLNVFNEWGREVLKPEALRALAEVGADGDAAAILKSWAVPTPAEVQRLAAETLAGRPAWAKALLNAVKEKRIDGGDISLPARRTLATLAAKDDGLKQLMNATLGSYRPTPGDKQKIIEAKKAVVMNGAVNKERGHELFMKNCAVCHQLNGEGAKVLVGPDLTGVGRGTLDLLLNNVIDPDQIIGAGYENTIIETADGDTKSGRVVEETDLYVKLLSAGPKEDVVPKKEIKERRVSQKSVMPEGFEQILKDDEFRDLMRFVLEAPVGKP
ncbi:MAG: putative rane-bound dehydrogenase [Phycisphaerales bacterium]|nr:putative rane-bound dehydrogenase [Phycisphaerales bacterium]